MSTLDTSACQLELTAANLCLQQTPEGECGCYDSPTTFVQDYPAVLQTLFFETQGYVSNVSPEFCPAASERMCDYFMENNSCCCGVAAQVYRKCVFDKVLVPAVPRIKAGSAECSDSCDFQTYYGNESEGNDSDGGGSIGVIIGASVGGLVFMLCLVYLALRCTRINDGDEDAIDNEKSLDRRAPVAAIDIEHGGSDEKTAIDNEHLENSESLRDEQEEPIRESKPKRPEERGVTPRRNISNARIQEEEVQNNVRREKIERLRKKKGKIKSWREERQNGSSRSLEDYLSDETLDEDS